MTKMRLKIKDLLFPGIDFLLRKRLRLVKKYLTEGEIKTLDVGCGNGAFCLLCYRLGNLVTGIDIDAGNIKRSLEYRDYKGISSSKVRFAIFNIYNLLELNQTFDQILCFETLEHLLNDQCALGVFAKLLNSGGVIHLGVPNLNCAFNLRTAISPTENGGHVRKGYTYAVLKEMLEGLGLKIVKENKYGGFFTRQVHTLYLRLQNLWIFKNFPKYINEVKNVLVFLCLNPFTYLDSFVEAEPISIYIMAKRIQK